MLKFNLKDPAQPHKIFDFDDAYQLAEFITYYHSGPEGDQGYKYGLKTQFNERYNYFSAADIFAWLADQFPDALQEARDAWGY